MLWSKNHIIALVIIAAVLWAMYRFSGLNSGTPWSSW